MSTLSQFMHGGAPRYYEEILASKTWTKPEGITTFFVEASGGSGFDGFGRYRSGLFNADAIPSSVAVTVGAGGSLSLSAGRAAETHGTGSIGAFSGIPGGATAFGSVLSSSGGARSGVGGTEESAVVYPGGQGKDRVLGITASAFSSGFVRVTGW